MISFSVVRRPLVRVLARVTIFSSWAGSSMAEQLTLNQRVAGSSPARLTTTN
jgi:hypothetical protein